MRAPRILWLVTVVSAGFALSAAGLSGRASAESRSRSLPTDCEANSIVVAADSTSFKCSRPQDALALRSCNEGDVVVADAFGRLRCQRSGGAPPGSKALLPTCASGEVLVSEGSGAWRCRPGALPSCGSGEILVSEGGSSWRCRPPPSGMPSCSSGEILVSQGSSGWKCDRR